MWVCVLPNVITNAITNACGYVPKESTCGYVFLHMGHYCLGPIQKCLGVSLYLRDHNDPSMVPVVQASLYLPGKFKLRC